MELDINDLSKVEKTKIMPGDVVYIPPLETNKVYVLGEVKTPGIVGIDKFSTVFDTIMKAGGFPKLFGLYGIVMLSFLANPISPRKVILFCSNIKLKFRSSSGEFFDISKEPVILRFSEKTTIHERKIMIIKSFFISITIP